MICYTCGHTSMHAACPFCGAKDVRRIVGFDPLDLISNPFGTAYQLGKDIGSSAQQSAPSYSSSDGPSLLDRLPSIPNPFSKAYDLGHNIGDQGVAAVKEPLDAVTSFFKVLRWVVIGGLVVGAVVVVYGVIKFLPVALGIAEKQAAMGVKTIGHVASRAV